MEATVVVDRLGDPVVDEFACVCFCQIGKDALR
jgi:hypothetical protein